MRPVVFLLVMFLLSGRLSAQFVYTIKADSVKLTSCDSSELIIENHTQNVPGFLFNTGNGRTIFKRGVVKINDSFYLIGGDTLKMTSNSWVQGGNAFGATGVLGTLDSNHLDFYTNHSQQMRLTGTGNLLVGTTTDLAGYKFNVKGQVYLDNGVGTLIATTPSNDLVIKSAALDANTSLLRFYNGTDVSSTYFSASPTSSQFGNPSGSFLLDISGGSSFMRINAYGNGSGITEIHNYGSGYYPLLNIVSPIQFHSPTPILGYNYLFVAQGSGGQAFAIQDSSLRNKFSVNQPTGDVLINKDPVKGDVDDGNAFQVRGGSSFSDSVMLNTVAIGSSSDSVLVWNAATHAIHKVAQSSIGATAIDRALNSSLAVNGVTAKKMRLSEKGWPDYVFARGYLLPQLKEIEEYIQQHGHLPGIPSAEEVEKRGVDVGDQQKALLKKIEELTLYTIEQDKKLEALEKELVELKKMMTDKNCNH